MESNNDKQKRLLSQAAHARAASIEQRAQRSRTHTSVRIYLHNNLHEVFKEEAEERGVSVRAIIGEAAEWYVKEHLKKRVKRGWGS